MTGICIMGMPTGIMFMFMFMFTPTGIAGIRGTPQGNPGCPGGEYMDGEYEPPSDMTERRLALLSRRCRTSIADAEDGGVEYIDGGREDPRLLPAAMLGGLELPGEDSG